MPLGKEITPDVENLVTKLHYENLDWKYTKLQEEVSKILHKENPLNPSDWPSLSSIQKIMAKVRKNEQVFSDEDKPWNVGSMAKYTIPPEALIWVLKIYKSRLENKEMPLTIRQAKWIGRLFRLFNDPKDYDILDGLAYWYAATEKVDSVLNSLSNTWLYDEGLIDYIIHPEKWRESHVSMLKPGKKRLKALKDHMKKLFSEDYKKYYREEWLNEEDKEVKQ